MTSGQNDSLNIHFISNSPQDSIKIEPLRRLTQKDNEKRENRVRPGFNKCF